MANEDNRRFLQALININENLLRRSTGELDYEMLAEGLLALCKAEIVIIMVLDEEKQKARVAAVSGLHKNIDKATDILGFKLSGKSFKLGRWRAAERKNSALADYNDMHVLSEGVVSQKMASLLKKVLGIGNIYGLAVLGDNNEVIADIILFMPVHRDLINPEALELFAGQLGLLLARLKAEQALRESEKKYRLLAENTSDVIWSMDMEMKFCYVNPAIYEITGYTEEEWIGSRLSDHCDEENYAILIGAIEKALSSLPVVVNITVEAKMIKKNGLPLSLELKGRLLLDEGGQVSGIQGVARDISLRRKAEADQKKEQQEKLAILENLAEQVIYLNTDLKIVWANRAAAEAHDLHQDQLGNCYCYQVWHEYAEPCPGCPLIKARETGVTVTGETYSQDGRIWLTTAVPIYDAEKKMVGLLNTSLDITQLKKAEANVTSMNILLEEKVKERTAQLEALIDELNAFTYSVSHDLRAPLRAVDGFSQVIYEDYGHLLDKDAINYLKRISMASQRMSELIDDLLKLSRISRQELRRDQINLSALVEELVANYREKSTGRNIEVTIQPDLYTNGDCSLLRIAINNLIDNAWKFTGMIEQPRIVFGADYFEGKRVYYIKDNGTGFDMGYAGKLFSAFYRLHSPDEFPGTGIGLSIVWRIIKRHGGKIWADGEVGRGATFYFTLPD